MLSGRFPGGSALHPYGADQTPLEQRPTFRPEKLATEDGISVRQYLVVETAFRSGQTVFVAGKVGPDGLLGAARMGDVIVFPGPAGAYLDWARGERRFNLMLSVFLLLFGFVWFSVVLKLLIRR